EIANGRDLGEVALRDARLETEIGVGGGLLRQLELEPLRPQGGVGTADLGMIPVEREQRLGGIEVSLAEVGAILFDAGLYGGGVAARQVLVIGGGFASH